MSNYNILILSVGRRVELVNLFKKAAKNLNIESSVIVADCSEMAPALYFGDKKYIIPKIDDSNYINSIIDISNQENIKLIIPTIDTELLILSKNKKLIENKTKAKIMISDYEMINICRDKIKTSEYLTSLGFNVPKTYNFEDIKPDSKVFPLFIKPISGSSSINAFKVNNYEELSLYTKLINNFMIQEYVGGDEYTVDAFLDFNSKPITIVPRLRIATRAGEISKGKIVKDGYIINTVKDLLSKTKFIGHITIQLKKDKTISFIEINPRFGGGAPMSIEAGANSCESLYNVLQNKTLYYNEDYKDNLVFLRYDAAIMIDEKDVQRD